MPPDPVRPELVPKDSAHNIKITSPDTGQTFPVGNLTMHGTSSDNVNTDCEVYVDWNDLRPFQPASPKGLAGTNDYSNWTFTYTKDYHLITSGSNELNANLFCLDNPNPEATSSINIIGQSPTKTDTGDSNDESGQDSAEDPFKFVVFCVVVEFSSNEEDEKEEEEEEDEKEEEEEEEEDEKEEEEEEDENENENGGDGCGGGDDDGNDGDGGNTECKKIVDKNGNGFGDEINAKENNLNLGNHEIVKSC